MTAISRAASRRPGRSTRWLTIALFVLPALILYADFVGLQNYVTAFGNKAFTTSIGNNALIVILSLLVQIPFSLGLAVLLNRNFPGRALFRLLFFLPYVLSEAVTGIVFTLMLQPDS